jgi:hypothetical protein
MIIAMEGREKSCVYIGEIIHGTEMEESQKASYEVRGKD